MPGTATPAASAGAPRCSVPYARSSAAKSRMPSTTASGPRSRPVDRRAWGRSSPPAPTKAALIPGPPTSRAMTCLTGDSVALRPARGLVHSRGVDLLLSMYDFSKVSNVTVGRLSVRRRRTGTIAAVSALGMTAVLGGCGLGGGSDEGTLRLVAADYGDSPANRSQKYLDKLVKEYEAEHSGVKIDVSVYSWTDVDRKVKELVDAGKAPDMAQIGAYADYAHKGLLYKADDLIGIREQADFVAQLASAGRINGMQYGMPFAASTRLLFYNKTLFADAGLTPPTTWKQLAADAAVLKADGVKYPYALPLGPEEAQAETMQWLLSGGGGYTAGGGGGAPPPPGEVNNITPVTSAPLGKGRTGAGAPRGPHPAAAV